MIPDFFIIVNINYALLYNAKSSIDSRQSIPGLNLGIGFNLNRFAFCFLSI